MKLNPFSYVVLALVGNGGAAPHDLVRMMRRGRFYWAAPASQFYAEPKRLAAGGYLSARKEPGQTKERTVYGLTDAGRTALHEWVSEPAEFPRIQHEAVVRLMAADVVEDDAAVLEGLSSLREDLAKLYDDLAVGERMVRDLPERGRYLTLNHRLARRLLDAHVQWLDETERELGGEVPPPAGSP